MARTSGPTPCGVARISALPPTPMTLLRTQARSQGRILPTCIARRPSATMDLSTVPEGNMSTTSHVSYSHGASADALLGETIGANLHRVAAAHANAEAMVDVPSGRRWTYAQLDADSDAVALGLIATGIDKADRVGIWAPNCPEWVLAQYGAAKAGAILVNINPAYRSHELAYVLRQSGIRLLVSAEGFKTSDYRGIIDEVRGNLPGPERVVYIGPPA